MSPGEVLAQARPGDVIAAGETAAGGYPPLVAHYAGPVSEPWEVTGMTHRLSNAQLLFINSSWRWLANTADQAVEQDPDLYAAADHGCATRKEA